MDTKGTELTDDIPITTHAQIEEIRNNIFSIYAKEFNFKRKCVKNNGTETVQNDAGENFHKTSEKQLQPSLGATETANKLTKCEIATVSGESRSELVSPESEIEHTKRPEVESRSSVSVDNGRSPIRVNTTSFSVTDILNPEKFTGVKLSPKGSWHPWVQREDKELVPEDSDDECMIDESGKCRGHTMLVIERALTQQNSCWAFNDNYWNIFFINSP